MIKRLRHRLFCPKGNTNTYTEVVGTVTKISSFCSICGVRVPIRCQRCGYLPRQ